MAQENIRLQQPNFCISPIIGTFASVDTLNDQAFLLLKNTSGDTTAFYTFNPNITKNTHIYHLEYIGPRNLTAMLNGMVFITMESNTTSSITIKKWNVNSTNSRLDLDYSIVKSTTSSEVIDCTNMAVGRYYTKLINTTITGSSYVVLDDTSYINTGDTLYLGPSTNSYNLNSYEEVMVTSTSSFSLRNSTLGKVTTKLVDAVEGFHIFLFTLMSGSIFLL